ncbi:MAG: hypothetical protein K6E95_04870 [Lachnospiraceae bacterium]|nr:hypothetical protein [Lachnospiraceae bacterium]
MTGKGGYTIEINDRFIEDTIRSVYPAVTQTVAQIELKEPPPRKKRIEAPISVVVLSKGIFKSKVVSTFPSLLVDEIVNRMSKNSQLSQEDRDAYFKEYINMCFGRFISKINNETGRASRFVIPVMIRGLYRTTTQDNQFSDTARVDFGSDYGSVNMVVSYDILPEYSSN